MTDVYRKPLFAQKTDRGLLREINEDACGYRIPEANTPAAAYGALFVVADGVGGMGRGEEASRAAVDAMLDTYYDPTIDDDSPRERVIAAIQDANDAVRARAKTLGLNMLGTTLAGVVILPDGRACAFNVGDSRIYRLHGDAFEQVTSDHSLIDAQDNLSKAKLTAFIGQFQPITPHLETFDFGLNDTLLICSDGLWGLVDPPEIAEVVAQNSPRKAVDVLIQKVHERGARDNVTVTIIQPGKSSSRFVQAALALCVLVALALFLLLQPILSPRASSDAVPVPTVEATADVTSQSNILATSEPDNSHGQLVIRTPTQQLKSDK